MNKTKILHYNQELSLATQGNFRSGGNEIINWPSALVCSAGLKAGLLYFSVNAYHPLPNTCLSGQVCICLRYSQMSSSSVLVTLGLFLDLWLPVSINSQHKHLPAANASGSPRNIASNKSQSKRKQKGEVEYNFLITATIAFSFWPQILCRPLSIFMTRLILLFQ